MNNLKKSKTQKGITLIALIITIIVLLILALVTIRAVQGDGIINYAQKAKNDYERESEAENTILGGYLSVIESNIPGGNNIVSGGQTINPIATVGIITTENSTINGGAYSSTNPIIPAGFMPMNTDTSLWDAEGGPEVDNGLVISDGNSEFVWVPVTSTIEAYGLETTDYREPDVITGVEPSPGVNSAGGTSLDAEEKYLTLAGCTEDLNGDNTVNAYDFKIQLTNEFNIMAESTNKYGGFYVGRYEISLKQDGTAQAKYAETSSDASQENTKSWYGLYKKAKTYTNEKGSVQSSMIWGSQYNVMMTWMGEAANITIGDDRNKTRETGTAPNDVIKNVYDLYGNSFEWTLEALYSYLRVIRGGDSIANYSPSYYRISWTPNPRDYIDPYDENKYYSSRITIYVV